MTDNVTPFPWETPDEFEKLSKEVIDHRVGATITGTIPNLFGVLGDFSTSAIVDRIDMNTRGTAESGLVKYWRERYGRSEGTA